MQSLIAARFPTTLDELEDLLFPAKQTTTSYPKVDVAEKDDGYVITAELPGMLKEDIKISVEENILTISGEKKKILEGKEKGFYHNERSYGSFSRLFSLTPDIDSKSIKASYINGVLEIKLNRTEETKPKNIFIKIE